MWLKKTQFILSGRDPEECQRYNAGRFRIAAASQLSPLGSHGQSSLRRLRLGENSCALVTTAAFRRDEIRLRNL